MWINQGNPKSYMSSFKYMWFYCKEKNKPVTRKKRNVTLEHATMKCADSAVKLADTGCTQTHIHTHTHSSHTFAVYLLFAADFI